jgi:hypothetical protein
MPWKGEPVGAVALSVCELSKRGCGLTAAVANRVARWWQRQTHAGSGAWEWPSYAKSSARQAVEGEPTSKRLGGFSGVVVRESHSGSQRRGMSTRGLGAEHPDGWAGERGESPVSGPQWVCTDRVVGGRVGLTSARGKKKISDFAYLFSIEHRN